MRACDVCAAPPIYVVVDTHQYADSGWLLSLPGRVRAGCKLHPPTVSHTHHPRTEDALAAMVAEAEATAC